MLPPIYYKIIKIINQTTRNTSYFQNNTFWLLYTHDDKWLLSQRLLPPFLLLPHRLRFRVLHWGQWAFLPNKYTERKGETGHRARLTRTAYATETGSSSLQGWPFLQLCPSPWHMSTSTCSDPWRQCEGSERKVMSWQHLLKDVQGSCYWWWRSTKFGNRPPAPCAKRAYF